MPRESGVRFFVVMCKYCVVIVGFAFGTAAYVLIPWIPLEFFPDTEY